jgi:hypothetical protein
LHGNGQRQSNSLQKIKRKQKSPIWGRKDRKKGDETSTEMADGNENGKDK